MNEQTVEDIEPIVEKTDAKKIFSLVFRFVKKHKLSLSALVITVIIFITLFNVIPVINVNDTKLVNLDTKVRIESGQTVKLKSGNVSVVINNFSNGTCPTGKKCFGSGPTVEYQLTVDNQKYATGTATPALGPKYQVETVSSDYKTYAEVKIVDSK